MTTCLGNTEYKKCKSLLTKKGRKEHGLFIAEGEKIVREIPKDWDIKYYVMSKSFCDEKPFIDNGIKTYVLDNHLFDMLTETDTPQGIIAVCGIKEFFITDILQKPEKRLILLLDDIRDPGNLGTILRTADAAGASGVILSETCADVCSPKAVRAAAGAHFHIPFAVMDLLKAIEILNQNNIKTLAAHLEARKYPYSFDMKDDVALIIGNEAHGISREVTEAADEKVKIPMIGQAESLNASMAAGILVYEAVRQRIESEK